MRVLVTGAGGFVGRSLVPRLMAEGHQIRAAVRRPAELPAAVEVVSVGDIGPDTDWRAALDGVDAVVHLAARVHEMHDRAENPLAAFRAVNTEGTRQLAETAAECGIRRFVFLSSIKAMADRSGRDPLCPDHAPIPTTPYGRSKLEAEGILDGLATQSRLEPVIFRPPLVYGPGVKGNFAALLSACWRRVPLPVGGIRNKRSLVFVGNLADAITRALGAESVSRGTFLIHDGAAMSTPEIVRQLGAALGRRAPMIPVPHRWLTEAARLPALAGPLGRLTESLEVDDSATRAALDWAPPYTVREGFARTARWYEALRTGA